MLPAKSLIHPYHLEAQQVNLEQAVLLMLNKRKKREAADLAAGRLVRITFYTDAGKHGPGLYPTRVAAFVCRVLGQPLPNSRGVRFDITTQGRLNSSVYELNGARLAMLAMLSYMAAEKKAIDRRFRAEQARLARQQTQSIAPATC